MTNCRSIMATVTNQGYAYMKRLTLLALLASVLAAPAFAQAVVPPAGPAADPGTNAAIAHHDAKVAHRAARHGHMRKAATASHAADAAAADAGAPH
jgi:hypothetical protein